MTFYSQPVALQLPQVDYSSPQFCFSMSSSFGFNTVLCSWILDFLAGRPQAVWMGTTTSITLTHSTGAPHSCVLSPLLYCLFTRDCMACSPVMMRRPQRHTGIIAKATRQRLFFLHRLRRFGMDSRILCSFYQCAIESLSTGCITAWYGSCTALDLKALQRVVKTAQHIARTELPAMQDLWWCRRKAQSILWDHSHPSHKLFNMLPSGKWAHEQRVQGEQQRCNADKEHLDWLLKTLGTVQAGVEHLADKLQYITLLSPDSEDFVVQLLAQCEQKLKLLHDELQGKDLSVLIKEMEEDEALKRQSKLTIDSKTKKKKKKTIKSGL
ncbi:hypothetical protein N1851_002530 [Merluccius polli]|uniref:Alkylated DNA repair protein AlkB homologue 8 N-terminal domain-containing protein n=1 Tax=Merluccius polli TaxID=89951 RepID=A0AA47NBH1_MERPO|nr:hypothetical protein N1851_002530 [Merluccius polli]